MEYSEKYGVVFILSCFGFLFLYEIESLKLIHVSRVSQTPVFTSVGASNDGILAINKAGLVCADTTISA